MSNPYDASHAEQRPKRTRKTAVVLMLALFAGFVAFLLATVLVSRDVSRTPAPAVLTPTPSQPANAP